MRYLHCFFVSRINMEDIIKTLCSSVATEVQNVYSRAYNRGYRDAECTLIGNAAHWNAADYRKL